MRTVDSMRCRSSWTDSIDGIVAVLPRSFCAAVPVVAKVARTVARVDNVVRRTAENAKETQALGNDFRKMAGITSA